MLLSEQGIDELVFSRGIYNEILKLIGMAPNVIMDHYDYDQILMGRSYNSLRWNIFHILKENDDIIKLLAW